MKPLKGSVMFISRMPLILSTGVSSVSFGVLSGALSLAQRGDPVLMFWEH